MRLFTTSPCHVTKIGNKTANINANIKLLQQSTFRRYAAIVLSPFFYFCCFRCVIVPLTGMINYVFCINSISSASDAGGVGMEYSR